ncbi:MAG: AtpZ/AtpI family protein [Holosporaceae bacterium]|jgi:F0F1-type ATP synthase assembly protein I|nr:AtpZ/AtpI family protein [Holosporaceae bacterium]
MNENKKNKYVRMANCGIEFVAAVAVGIFGGLILDKYFDKSPLFLIIFFILGCGAGYWNLFKYAGSISDKISDKK